MVQFLPITAPFAISAFGETTVPSPICASERASSSIGGAKCFESVAISQYGLSTTKAMQPLGTNSFVDLSTIIAPAFVFWISFIYFEFATNDISLFEAFFKVFILVILKLSPIKSLFIIFDISFKSIV